MSEQIDRKKFIEMLDLIIYRARRQFTDLSLERIDLIAMYDKKGAKNE